MIWDALTPPASSSHAAVADGFPGSNPALPNAAPAHAAGPPPPHITGFHDRSIAAAAAQPTGRPAPALGAVSVARSTATATPVSVAAEPSTPVAVEPSPPTTADQPQPVAAVQNDAIRAAASLAAPVVFDTAGKIGQNGWLLPAGYLHTNGNQIVDASGNPVRIASIGWSGTDGLTFAPYGLWQSSLQQNINAIAADGFNTIRIPWTDVMLNASPEESATYAAINPTLNPNLVGLTSLQLLDVLVADAGKAGLKVIFDHHDDNGGPGGWGGQQANGLWIDSGPGTNGTDGSGTTGTVTAAKFLADSVEMAKNFAGNSTVIGFDLDNEPTSAGDINWGKGGPTDIHAMYTQVGDAIQAVDPGALIIAEGPEEWSGPAPGMPAGFGEGDLSGVATDPVKLTIPNKVVYSVHEYPPDLSGNGSYNAATQIVAMNAGWGYLETKNIAPVWIGEMGSNMTSATDSAWIQMLLNYMNGADAAEGGPKFSGSEQPVSGSWWQWGSAPGQDPDGVETAWGSGVYQPAQQAATDELLYKPTTSSSTVRTVAAGSSVNCFVEATHIATPDGSATVETLRQGSLIRTAAGASRPVRWVGHRRLDLTGHPQPDRATPVRIQAGAIAPNQPDRDLLVSPDHGIFIGGVLIPARLLINGGSIVAETGCRTVTYYHVELDSHDILLAEGVPAESYLDTGNRALFDNGGQPLRLHPTFADGQTARETRSCVPFSDSPAAVEPVWRSLANRAQAMGWRLPDPPAQVNEPDLHVLAGTGGSTPSTRKTAVTFSSFRPPTRPARLVSRRPPVRPAALGRG